jgi:hypothetical protein
MLNDITLYIILTNCLNTIRNIVTPERISHGHVQNGRRAIFHGPFCIIKRAFKSCCKDIAILIQTWTGPKASRELRLPVFKTVCK